MKTMLIAAAFMAATFSVSAKNKTTAATVNYQIAQTFQSEYANAENVEWGTSANNLVRASFTNEGEKVNAFFSQDGEFVASTVELTKDKLPAKLQAAISKKYGNTAITEAISMQKNNELDRAYYVKFTVNGIAKLIKGFDNGFLKEVSLETAQ